MRHTHTHRKTCSVRRNTWSESKVIIDGSYIMCPGHLFEGSMGPDCPGQIQVLDVLEDMVFKGVNVDVEAQGA